MFKIRSCFLGSLIFLFAWEMVESDPIKVNQLMKHGSGNSPKTMEKPFDDKPDKMSLSQIVVKLLEIAEDEDSFSQEVSDLSEQDREMLIDILNEIKGPEPEKICREEDGYRLVNNRICLKLYEYPNVTNWEDSKAICEEDGGTLYSPDHPDFLKEIRCFMANPAVYPDESWIDIWVGLKQNEGTHTYNFTSGKTITIDLGTGQDTSGEVDLPWYVYYSRGPFSSYWDVTTGPDFTRCFAYHHQPEFTVYGLHEYYCDSTGPFLCEVAPH